MTLTMSYTTTFNVYRTVNDLSHSQAINSIANSHDFYHPWHNNDIIYSFLVFFLFSVLGWAQEYFTSSTTTGIIVEGKPPPSLEC